MGENYFQHLFKKERKKKISHRYDYMSWPLPVWVRSCFFPFCDPFCQEKLPSEYVITPKVMKKKIFCTRFPHSLKVWSVWNERSLLKTWTKLLFFLNPNWNPCWEGKRLWHWRMTLLDSVHPWQSPVFWQWRLANHLALCMPVLCSSSRVRKRLWADEVDEAFVDGDPSEDEASIRNDKFE